MFHRFSPRAASALAIGLAVAFALLSPCPAIVRAGFLSTDAPPETAAPFAVAVAVEPAEIPAGGAGVVRVRIDMADGFKIYADDTSVRPQPTPGIVFGTTEYPASVVKAEPDGNPARFFEGEAVLSLPFRIDARRETGPLSLPLEVAYRGCSETTCFFPVEKTVAVALNVMSAGTEAPAPALPDGTEAGTDRAPAEPATGIVPERPADSPSAGIDEENPFRRTARRFGLPGAMIAAFLWGFLASLTPCVYPMIPITVGVIGAANSGDMLRGFGLSLFYVLGMSLTYAAFGVAAAWSGGLFGAYAGHPAVRIAVAGVFVVLALSLFDLFYLQMPAAVSTRLAGFRKSGGAAGVFLAGAVSGAVVGPCVGPMLAGLLIYIAGIGDRIQGFLLMWSFALGMGLLFLAIGTFSGAAALLPRSGTWMVRLKGLFGLLMLGAALYYVAPLLPHSVDLLLLGALLIGTGVYAGALDRTDAETGRWDRLWKTAGVLALVLGVVYAARFAMGDTPMRGTAVSATESGGILWLDDHAAGLALARETGRPVMIDFTAEWCALCRQLETRTFPDPDVVRMARNFVAIRIDATDASAPRVRDLQRRYGVVGLPTLIFLAPTGDPLSGETLTEFVPPAGLLARMARVRQRIESSTDPTRNPSGPTPERSL